MKKTTRKLTLNTQTVRWLTPDALNKARGGYMQEPTEDENSCTSCADCTYHTISQNICG